MKMFSDFSKQKKKIESTYLFGIVNEINQGYVAFISCISTESRGTFLTWFSGAGYLF